MSFRGARDIRLMRSATLPANLLVTALVALASVTACAVTDDASEALTRDDAVRAGTLDPGHFSVGGLRRVGASETFCTATLIHPRVALTAAHCLADFGNGCTSEAAARAGFEVVFTTGTNFRDATRVIARRPAALAVHPRAFPSPIATCPTTPFTPCGSYGVERTVDEAFDLALVLLDQPVSPNVVRHTRVVTNGFGANAANVTAARARLDDPAYGPNGTTRVAATVVGFGVGDVCGEERRGGAMFFHGTVGTWHRACRTVLACDGRALVSESVACPAGDPSSASIITMERAVGASTTYPAPFVGPYVGSGDSGGPLLFQMVPGPGLPSEVFVIGVLSAARDGGGCTSSLDTRQHEAWYAPTFGVPSGTFLESQLSAWLGAL